MLDKNQLFGEFGECIFSREIDHLVHEDVSGNVNVRRSDRENHEDCLEMRSKCLLKCEEIYTIIIWFEAEIDFLNQGMGMHEDQA